MYSKTRTALCCLIFCVAVIGVLSSQSFAAPDSTPMNSHSHSATQNPIITVRSFTIPTTRTRTSRTRITTTVITGTTAYCADYSCYPYYPYYPYYPNYAYSYYPSSLSYSPSYYCYVDPNNPYVCYLYPSSSQYGYPPYLYYSQYLGCYVDPNNSYTCYPYLSTSPPNGYSPSPYQINPYQTTTTQSSYVTQTSYSTLVSPALVVSTLTNTVTTTDNSINTLYGAAIAGLLVLLGVSVFLLLVSRSGGSKTSNQPQTYANAYRCSNCGNDLKQTDRFCGRCGAQIDGR